jgi:tetratricopeptide (TPR) repeat protein
MNHRHFSFKRAALRLLVCLSISTAAAVGAAAQTAQPGQTDYQSLVEKGLQEYELGNFSEAKAFFQQAHRLSPNARTLRGLGMTAYEMRRYVEAIGYFELALASNERALTTQLRTEVTQLLSQARSFVAKLNLAVTPGDAQLRLDTREVVRDKDGSILLDPGVHELLIEAPKHEPVTRSIRSDGGEALTLVINLRNTEASPAIEGTPVELAPTPALAAGSEPTPALARESSTGPYVMIGVSAAVAIAGGVLLAVALSNKASVENPNPSTDGGPRYADYQDKADSVLPLSAAGITALSVGVAGAAAGLTWKLMSDGERSPTAALSVAPGGLSLHGNF